MADGLFRAAFTCRDTDWRLDWRLNGLTSTVDSGKRKWKANSGGYVSTTCRPVCSCVQTAAANLPWNPITRATPPARSIRDRHVTRSALPPCPAQTQPSLRILPNIAQYQHNQRESKSEENGRWREMEGEERWKEERVGRRRELEGDGEGWREMEIYGEVWGEV